MQWYPNLLFVLECSHQTQVDTTVIVICLFKTDSDLVKDIVVECSVALEEIADNLNNRRQCLKNWRHLAHKLGIRREVYESFDTSKEDAHSSTVMMFELLRQLKPNLTVKNLLDGLKEIERLDVADLVKQEVTFGKGTLHEELACNDIHDE